MQQNDNRREFSRVPAHVTVKLEKDAGDAIKGETRDLSLNGFFVECDERLPVGYAGDMKLILHGGKEDVDIDVFGKVVRETADGIAVEITAIYGVDCFNHLRNLVLYNADDPEKTLEEFNSHTGLRPAKPIGRLEVS